MWYIKLFFDTLRIELQSKEELNRLREIAIDGRMNFYYTEQAVQISLDETTNPSKLIRILNAFLTLRSIPSEDADVQTSIHEGSFSRPNWDQSFDRTSDYLTHPIFNSYHSETAMMRYIKKLEKKDLSLTSAMIPLGSCTMKLNAATQLIPVSFPEFAGIHPFAPINQTGGYQRVIHLLGEALCTITGFSNISFQPNSGAQGEYAGLMVIRAFHENNGEAHRNIALIPSSAHGTNPASAVMAGMKVVVVQCDEMGNIDVSDLTEKAEQYSSSLACLMITYPSTHGVFESNIKEISHIIHSHGGQVYMDGANMNAQVGLTHPAHIGADVCHLNLHKTFSIPHGGGGPGMGPICVASHLGPFLPKHPIIPTGGQRGITAIAATPYGSASILLISLAYIYLLGKEGLIDSTRYAIINANYMKSRLESSYSVLFQGENGRVAHEFIIDLREFKQKAGLEVDDITKRLIDYGFHAPTVSWPVPGTIMIEPTESEPLAELDRFCDAMISIREEIKAVELGLANEQDNMLKNAPHTLIEVTADEWEHGYSRKEAAYPTGVDQQNKFWPSVSRIDNGYGDRNLVCTCPDIASYQTEAISNS